MSWQTGLLIILLRVRQILVIVKNLSYRGGRRQMRQQTLVLHRSVKNNTSHDTQSGIHRLTGGRPPTTAMAGSPPPVSGHPPPRCRSAWAHVVSLMIVSQFLIICLPATGGKQPTTAVVAAHHQGGGRPATTVVGGSPLRWWAACHRWWAAAPATAVVGGLPPVI